MNKALGLLLAGAVAISAVPVSASAALASSNSDVHRSGVCGSHPWTLELSLDSGRIEADYELHHVAPTGTWLVVMKDNGVRFFRGTRTAGSDRYIEVDRYTKDQTGTDKITVRATDTATGKVCRASASIS
jgi:hypothetical protein